MKKLKLMALELGADEILSRPQLKNIFGGSGGSIDGPGDPEGGDGGSKQYKCCWDSYPTSCSACVPCVYNCRCKTGAHLVEC